MSEELWEWEAPEDCAPDEPFDEPLFDEPQPVRNANGLFPCPFCGGEAEVCIEKHTWPPVRVRCSKCGIATQWEITDIEAAEKWNARAERTCRNAEDDGIWFECSECGEYLTVEFFDGGYGTPRFCPCCGARVVEE